MEDERICKKKKVNKIWIKKDFLVFLELRSFAIHVQVFFSIMKKIKQEKNLWNEKK